MFFFLLDSTGARSANLAKNGNVGLITTRVREPCERPGGRGQPSARQRPPGAWWRWLRDSAREPRSWSDTRDHACRGATSDNEAEVGSRASADREFWGWR